MENATESIDNIYWLFSSAAQSIAALFALLLAGYTLVHMLMDTAEGKDETLTEVHIALRREHYQVFTAVAYMAGGAIILSLISVFLNPYKWDFLRLLYLISGLLDFLTILGGILFVVSIVDPDKYIKAAKREIEEELPDFVGPRDDGAPAQTFFHEFIRLENIVRQIVQYRQLSIPSQGSSQMSFSFRQMTDALFQNEIINRNFLNELRAINKYRNLVFHGRIEDVNRGMLNRAHSARSELQKLLDQGFLTPNYA
jgi:hypothetical protein